MDIPQLPKGQTCVDIHDIEASGITLFSASRQKSLIQPYVNSCMDLSDINDLLGVLAKAYNARGYITSRAYLPPQDLSTGKLMLVVVEGEFESLELEGSHEGWALATAFPGLEGHPLNLRDIEQGLDQINRLGSNSAKLKIQPGQKQGGSHVIITNEPDKRWRVSTFIDNSGSESTGEIQGELRGAADNLLGLNDYWSATWKRDLHQDDAKGSSQAFSGIFSIPYGYWTLTGSSSYSEYKSRIVTPTEPIITSGYARGHRVELDRVVHRDQVSKTSLSGAILWKNNVNYTNDVRLPGSSRKLTIASAALSHSRRVFGGVFSGRADYHRGLTAFGAAEDNNLDYNSPRAQFDRFTSDVSFYLPVTLGGENLALSTYAHGQYSPDTLHSTEQIFMGGLGSVRGFKESSLYGDVGGYVRTEMIWNAPQFGEEFADNFLGEIQLFTAFDIGALRGDHKNPSEHGTLKGWAGGLRNSNGWLDFDVTYSQAISSPSHVDPEDHEIYFKAGLNF